MTMRRKEQAHSSSTFVLFFQPVVSVHFFIISYTYLCIDVCLSILVVEVCSDKPAPKSAEVPQAKLFVEGAEETRPRASSPIPEGVSAQPQHPEDASQAEASAGEGCGDTRPPQETQPLATPCLSGFQVGFASRGLQQKGNICEERS